MSQPARPTRLKRKATLAPLPAIRMSETMAMIAPAPAQMPSTAAMTGCGQARISLTRSPVMVVKACSSAASIFVSGSMISKTSPPLEKLPPEPVTTMAVTSSSKRIARKVSRSSA